MVDTSAPAGISSRSLTGEAFLAAVVFGVGALADAPKAVRIGSVTGLALTSLAFFVLGILSLLAKTPGRELVNRTKPLCFFFVWASVSAIFRPPTAAGFQNLVVLASFLVLILVVAGEARRDPSLDLRVIRYGRRLAGACSLFYILNTAGTHVGFSPVMFPRQFALAALVGLSCLLAVTVKDRRSSIVKAVALVGLIGLTQSRSAFAIGVFLVVVFATSGRQRKPINVRRVLLSLGGAVALMSLLAFNVPALHDRFFGGYAPIKVAGLEIASSGRATYWQATIESWLQSPWVGHGAGSASTLIDSKFPGIGHPLNEYLRLLHDYGIVGTTLWLWGLFRLLGLAWRRANLRTSLGQQPAIQRAAVLGIFSLLGTMVTDNPLVYIFVMGPLAVIIGCAVGSKSPSEPALQA
jgi:O-antigen ligase